MLSSGHRPGKYTKVAVGLVLVPVYTPFDANSGHATTIFQLFAYNPMTTNDAMPPYSLIKHTHSKFQSAFEFQGQRRIESPTIDLFASCSDT